MIYPDLQETPMLMMQSALHVHRRTFVSSELQ